jgi:hypothetical protein
MEVKCPKCGKPLPSSSINITTDLGKCDGCNNVFKLSEAIDTNEISELLHPPNGSKIEISKNDNSIEILLKAKKFSASDIFPVIFSLFWVSFLVFWTIGAAQGSIFFALFSIPFWFVGVNMMIGLFNSFDEDHIITITKDQVELLKNRPINSKEYHMKYSNIYSIKIAPMRISNPFSMALNFRLMSKFNFMGMQIPTINFENETVNFFDQGSDAEQEWIVRFLNSVLKKNKAAI